MVTPKRPLATFEEAWAASPAGFLSQLDAINTNLEFRKLLILSPLVSFGDTQEEAHEPQAQPLQGTEENN